MKNLLEGLDETQKQVVVFRNGPLLVAASPGSGKTRCLTHRMAYLISQGVSANRILMLTFTRSAGDEMAERVAALTGIYEDGLAKHISTFHSLGARILLNSQWALTFKLAAKDPIQPGKCKVILGKVSTDIGITYSLLRAYISRCKRNDVDVKQAMEEAGEDSGTHSLFVNAYRLYEENKRMAGVLDFDDLIFLPSRLLRHNDKVRARYQNSYDYVMVDEFPDTDSVQMQMVDNIVKPKNNIVVVGDSSQAIFSWRGGNLDIFMNFDEWYPGHKTILLARNYRSLPSIVDCYKKIITGAPSVVPGFLEAITSNRTETAPAVQVWTSATDHEEATKVADSLLARPADSKASYAILVRTNRQMRVLEEHLSAAAIPYIIVGSSSFFNRPEVKAVIAYLRVLEDPCDNEAMTQVILGKSKLTKFLGKAYAEELRSYAGTRGMLTLMSEFGKPWQRRKGQEIQDFFHNVEVDAASMHVTEQLALIVEEAGIVRNLLDEGDLDEIDNSVEENIQEVIKAAAAYDSRAKFIQYADLMSRKPSSKDVPVKMLTCHRGKGLEFDAVYLCGFNDDIIPHRKSEDIEEERRIAYVGISRARNELYISSYGEVSRFMKYLQVKEASNVQSV